MEKTKKFRIIIQGQQNTNALLPLECHEYSVRGNSMDEAQKQALAIYQKSFPQAENIYVAKKSRLDTIAIICLSIACFLSFIPWYTGGEKGLIPFSLKPKMITTALAIGLYSAVVLRVKGLQNSFNSLKATVLSILTIFLCSSFLNFFIGDMKFRLPPLIKELVIPGKIILAVAFLLSWLGVAFIAKIAWVVLFVFAAIQIMIGDAAMGFWGNVYVITAFLGIVFQLKRQGAGFSESLGKEIVSLGAQIKHRVFNNSSAVASAKLE